MNDRFSNRLRRTLVAGLLFCLAIGDVHAADKVVLVAGGSGDEGGPATEAKLVGPFGVDFDRSGNAFLVEIAGHRVLKIDRQGVLIRVAGTGMMGDGGDGGLALKAEFNGMHGLAVASSGDIFVADTWNNRVRKIESRTGTITALAGTGKNGYSGDGGPADRAEFGGIYCVALDPQGERLVLTDLDNRRIRVVDLPTGIVTTAAGNGNKGIPADEADARKAPLVDPRAAVLDSRGNLWVLERGGNALRVVDPQGKIRTVIGDGKGDVTVKGPKHLCIDRDGNVIIADTENHRILKYAREAKTVPVAGTGEKGTAGVGGPPDQVQLNQPHGVAIGPSGELYIVDSSNNRVLKIERSEQTEGNESAKQDPRLDFVDITASMLGNDGKPRSELFVKDGLHLSPAGYKSWASQLLPVLEQFLVLGLAVSGQGPYYEPFPAHRVIGNVYHVGSKDLASYLITTRDGHILINSGFEETVPLIRDGVESLGFKMHDIKILLASHAHSDHVAGHALAKEWTGAKVAVMRGDDSVIASGGKGQYLYTESRWKPCTVDRVLEDGDEVKLGDVTLVARRTPGHTRGCTTWTWRVLDGDKSYLVVVIGSPNVNPGYQLVNNKEYPEIAGDFAETFKTLKSLPCDVFLGAHGSYYGMIDKYERAKRGDAANPFIDPDGYKAYVNQKERAFRSTLATQQGTRPPSGR